MEIPYTITARPDTGLWNAKVGIWLFLASEVMLFGGLFSGYVFLRLGADPGYWPHGLLNVPIGTFNTAILIFSSVTVVFAWAALKMRQFNRYRVYMAITILCGIAFLGIKLGVEWPPKFEHFGAYIKPAAIEKYEAYLGNKHLADKGLAPRYEITGHLHEVAVNKEGVDQKDFDALLNKRGLKVDPKTEEGGKVVDIEVKSIGDAMALGELSGARIESFKLALDEVNADPDSPENDRPHFIPRPITEKIAVIQADDIDGGGQAWSAFVPRHSSYFAVYFLITGLHGLHVLAGVLVFIYYMLPVSTRLYRENPEHLANRVEVAGLFWHFVDLVWIFVFPIFYLL
ncbi:MAG: cytochrome c oxidase subunit 3 [Chthoniobacteraceae bacterium]